MRLREIKELVSSTADAAFAVDGAGLIVAWNRAAETLFGLSAEETTGKSCGSIIQGMDECGPVCSPECAVRQAAQKHHPVGNFDLLIQTAEGQQWCNVSVLIAEENSSTAPFSIHIVRPIDVRKKLELAMRDFLVKEAHIPQEQLTTIKSANRAPARAIELSEREIEIIRLLAKGATTVSIASQLHISRVTVSNHIQHILRKLGAHTRLEAIRRAEHAGLI
jgi:PAS domain S-box-containing protein